MSSCSELLKEKGGCIQLVCYRLYSQLMYPPLLLCFSYYNLLLPPPTRRRRASGSRGSGKLNGRRSINIHKLRRKAKAGRGTPFTDFASVLLTNSGCSYLGSYLEPSLAILRQRAFSASSSSSQAIFDPCKVARSLVRPHQTGSQAKRPSTSNLPK